MANVETLVIVVAPVPEADLMLADRQMARAVRQGMQVLLCVNKVDLDESLLGGQLCSLPQDLYAGGGTRRGDRIYLCRR